MWFKDLVGFDEISTENVRNKLYIEGKNIISRINKQSYQFGTLEIPTLKELKEKSTSFDFFQDSTIQVSEIVGDVQELHCLSENKNSLFQAASQFNLLEMVGPEIIPEKGVGIYENDFTQGPACAIACGAGTIYRNYFIPVNDQIGQSENTQIDCLDLIGQALNNKEFLLWQMRNGYALANREGLLNINAQLAKLNEKERENLKGKLKIGIQWETEVTLVGKPQIVSQAYCSALPVSYSFIEEFYWENFASLILEATYEATLYAGLINLKKNNCNKVFLTLVGGGAFGNNPDWIKQAIIKAIRKFKNTPLDIKIMSFRESDPIVQELLKEIL